MDTGGRTMRRVCTQASAVLLAALLLTGATVRAVAAERELAAPVEDFLEVEVATVGLAADQRTPVVLLRPPAGGEVIPIFIGSEQARSILLALREARVRRPLTHDLLGRVIESLDAELERVYVDAIVDNTFLGMLELHVDGREQHVRIDTRPSDAIALALRTGASIHVAPSVREEARLIDYRGLDEQQQVVSAIGITVMTPDDDLRQALDLPDRDGVVVTDVVGAVRGAGLESGALILGVNGETPDSPMAFLRLVHATPAKQKVRIRYWLNDETGSVELPQRIPERGGSRL